MHYVAAGEYFKSLDHLFEISKCSLLWEGSLLLHEFIKCSSIAIFIDEIEVIGCFEHIDVLNNVGA